MLVDPYERHVTYLRVSVTDRCDFRCVYCMSEHMSFLPKIDLLSLEELDRLCTVFISLGIKKLRITGGEPLVRRNIITLFHNLGRHLKSGALEELTLTTNGSQLDRYAAQLYECGVRRINVSLDTLDKEKFIAITRWGKYDKVLKGIAAAQSAGLKVKINTVALKGVNDNEIESLVTWCGEKGMDLTFIETMPMGYIDGDRSSQYLPLTQVRSQMEKIWTLDNNNYNSGGPARYVTLRETGQQVGFITPLTHNFCESCNRVRLTCTGTLFMCLGQEDAADLRASLRSSTDDNEIISAIHEAISRKPKGHDFIIAREPSISRHMSVTGG